MVLALGGCFSKPDMPGHVADADGDGQSRDGQSGACTTWGPWGSTIDLSALDPTMMARGPWLSPDHLDLVYQAGTSTDLVLAHRTGLGAEFGPATILMSNLMSNVSTRAQPFLSDDLLEIWVNDSAGHIQTATRMDQMTAFGPLTVLDSLGNGMNHVGSAQVSTDRLTMLVTLGDFPDQQIGGSVRPAPTQPFPPVTAIAGLNDTTFNQCSPTAAGSLVLFERRTDSGKYEIYESTDLGNGTYSQPTKFAPLSNPAVSYGEPHLTRDGSALVYVEVDGTSQQLRMIERSCLD